MLKSEAWLCGELSLRRWEWEVDWSGLVCRNDEYDCDAAEELGAGLTC